MAKEPRKSKDGEQQHSTAEYYKLKTEAVEDLVSANEGNAPEVSKEEMKRYGARKKGGMPGWLKVGFIKWWFPAAVFYFLVMSRAVDPQQNGFLLDAIVILGIVMGMVTDLLTDNMIRFTAPTDGEYDVFLMFPRKRYVTFILNILYALVLCAAVFLGWYSLAGMLLNFEEVSLVRDLVMGPVGFGLFYMASDVLLVGIKYLIKKLVCGMKNKNVQEG